MLVLAAMLTIPRVLFGAESVVPPASRGTRGAEASPFVRAPYLQLATPSSITVVWRTPESIQPAVRYGIAPDRLDRLIAASGIVTRVALTTNEVESKVLGGTRPEVLRLPRLHGAPAGVFQPVLMMK